MAEKINFDRKLKGLDGEDLKVFQSNEVVDLKTVCIQALIGAADGEKQIPPQDKIKYYHLAQKIYGGGEIELSSEEIVAIKKLIGENKSMGVIVVGQSWEMLEGKL